MKFIINLKRRLFGGKPLILFENIFISKRFDGKWGIGEITGGLIVHDEHLHFSSETIARKVALKRSSLRILKWLQSERRLEFFQEFDNNSLMSRVEKMIASGLGRDEIVKQLIS